MTKDLPYCSTATASIDGDQAAVTIRYMDYAAWAMLRVILRMDGSAIHPDPIILTLPHDANGDRIADHWQRGEVRRWNHQFRLKPGDRDPDWINPDAPDTWTAIFGNQGEADAELARSDGPDGPMPAMADDGDGLTALKEYRGFFFDGGPGITNPNHLRLSVARKELLVDCIEMIGTPFAQGYSLSGTMGAVSNFCGIHGPPAGNPGYFVGAMLDTYWVRRALNDTGTYVAYADGTTRLAYKHTGTYIDQRIGNNMTGTLCMGWDRKLHLEDQLQAELLYGFSSAGLGILAHELGYMIIDATANGEHWPEEMNNLMNIPVGLSNTIIIKDEIEHVNLRKRASVKP